MSVEAVFLDGEDSSYPRLIRGGGTGAEVSVSRAALNATAQLVTEMRPGEGSFITQVNVNHDEESSIVQVEHTYNIEPPYKLAEDRQTVLTEALSVARHFGGVVFDLVESLGVHGLKGSRQNWRVGGDDLRAYLAQQNPNK